MLRDLRDGIRGCGECVKDGSSESESFVLSSVGRSLLGAESDFVVFLL